MTQPLRHPSEYHAIIMAQLAAALRDYKPQPAPDLFAKAKNKT